MKFLALLFSALVALITFLPSPTIAASRGLAWGTNNNWGPSVAKGLIEWYWHWQDGPNSRFNGKLEFVPCFWGPKYYSQWNQRKQEMNQNVPSALLGFNEPDISGQSNLDPTTAANLWMKEIQPWKKRGVRLGSPQIVYNQDWLGSFMNICRRKGCTVDFIAIHWYGSWNDLAGLQRYVRQVRARFNLPIWITEYGVTSSSGGSQRQIKQFHMDATNWLNSQSYIERTSNFGSFPVSRPPDAFGSRLNAMFNGDGSLRDLAHWYVWSSGNSRRSLRADNSTAEDDFEPTKKEVPIFEKPASFSHELDLTELSE
ncbi:Glycosyl hydrolase [Kalmanozyma brasiliensis GHG001]|uniref:Asl1-like glycosyl hydrolase catalytic domain-containing protein n=1 Tax=Kalmanozyma brasiliensis (strain GHG001) TaxID=1365824 RepID=V5F0C1_KALBG|nr:Glycosyl hydrolase [Kalmanozyma brasiliensis GHG001]EST09733.1 Glycosyl hydrolase [Kalmanozyma brasiliensis GHG001]